MGLPLSWFMTGTAIQLRALDWRLSDKLHKVQFRLHLMILNLCVSPYNFVGS